MSKKCEIPMKNSAEYQKNGPKMRNVWKNMFDTTEIKWR